MADYKITLPLEKADNSDGRWVITGAAAGLGPVDSEGQILRPVAIERLAKRIRETPIPFKDWHSKNTSFSELGVVTDAKVTEDFELAVEVELDQSHPFSQLLWKKMDEGKKYGFSIGGKSDDWKVEEENGKKVVAVYDVDIDELSLTTKPIWTPSFGTVIKKAIDEEIASTSVEEVEKVEEQTTTAVADVIETETVTSAPENVTEPVSIEKAVTAETARERQKVARLVKYVKGIDSLLSELGLSVEEEVKAETSTEPVQIVEKSADESEDRIATLERALDEQKATIELLKAQMPSTPMPGVLIREKSTSDEALEILKSKDVDPRDRLRFGLAIMHNEAEKLR